MSKTSHDPRSLCVLFVEDDDADAYLVQKVLTDNRRVGSVVRAVDGADAIRMLQVGDVVPDFIITDLHMPSVNGLDLLVALVDQGLANVPVVVLTSSSAQSDAIRSRVRGALQVLVKPESIRELFTMISSSIDALCSNGAAADDANTGRARFYLSPTLPSTPEPRTLRKADAHSVTSAVFGRRA